MKFKRIVSGLMGAALAVSLSVPAFAAEESLRDAVRDIVNNRNTGVEAPKEITIKENPIKSFSDVPRSHWAHDAIMEMVDMGLFQGTTTPVDGVGTFSPEDTMTRAQFLAVVTRYLYKDELAEMEKYGKPDIWYERNYNMAVSCDLISEREFSKEGINRSMSRQEMAMVLVRAAGKLGQYPKQLISTLRIADYDEVGLYYQDYVIKCYSMGMICGVDSKGTFAPQGTLNRAQAAAVLYRLISSEARQEVDFSIPDKAPEPSVVTIYEGQPTSRPAKAGDIYVKADGTKVTLKIGPNGILGEGQGVAPDKNLTGSSMWWTQDGKHNRFNFNVDVHGNLTDSLGVTLQNQNYGVNKTTGEGHWTNEWNALKKIYKAPKENGTYYGQVSTDPYKLYVWDGMGDWVVNFR